MRYPLRMVIHVAQRKTIDFRPTLVALQCSRTVDQALSFFGYDLSAPLRPAKTRRHALVTQIAGQIRAGYSIAVWDMDRFMSDLSAIVAATMVARPRLSNALDADWKVISNADDETLIDLRSFSRLPRGHYLALVAARDREISLPFRLRRVRVPTPERPRAEELWAILLSIIFEAREADAAMSAYKGWVRAGRPKPPGVDAYLPTRTQ